VLLALLLAGVLGAGAWLSVSLHPPGTQRTFRAKGALHSMDRQRRAADALMAHATLYADLYGPTGAGPGHLACPDRHRSPGRPAAAHLLPLAGPDPPCATRPTAHGALPVHIAVGRLKAGIDPAPVADGALSYRVAAAVVNNPLGRPVNARTLPQVLARIGTVAAPGSEVAATSLAAGMSSNTPLALRRRATGPAIRRRVGAWLVRQLVLRSAIGDCALPATCSGLTVPGSQAVDGELIDGVPAARHWFVRNGWAADFDVQATPGCHRDPTACRVSIDPGVPMSIRFLPPPLPLPLPPPP